MTEPRPDVSIVVVSWNTRELLERCMAEAHASAPSLAREVIVVDNASSDGSAEWLAEHWPNVALVRNPANRGYAPACNQGLRVARGRFVMALNTDAFLVGDALGALVRELESHPELGAVGPRLLNADGTTQWVCARRAPRFATALFVHTMLPAYVPSLGRTLLDTYPDARYAQGGKVDVLSGACLLFRREALERAGFLDDRLVLNYDDVEWSVRARRAGWQLGYVPAAEVVHLGGQSRALDAESASAAALASIFVFWDLAFARPSAFLLKLNLGLSMCASLAKNALLAPFVPWRRGKAAHLVRLLGTTVASAFRPAHRAA